MDRCGCARSSSAVVLAGLLASPAAQAQPPAGAPGRRGAAEARSDLRGADRGAGCRPAHAPASAGALRSARHPGGLPSSILGVTLFLGTHPAGYFLMVPQMCAELAAFHKSPASFDPRVCRDGTLPDHRRGRCDGARDRLAPSRTTCSGTRTRRRSSATACNRSGTSRASSAPLLVEAQAIGKFYATQLYPLRQTADIRVLDARSAATAASTTCARSRTPGPADLDPSR